MLLDWLGEKYNDKKCLQAGTAIENGVVYALRNRQSVPDCGGKTTTVGMAEAIAAALTVKTGWKKWTIKTQEVSEFLTLH